MKIEEFKKHFYTGTDTISLNNSGQSLVPDVYRNKMIEWLDRFSKDGGLCSIEGWAQTEVTRKKLAAFLGADVHETSFFTTTSSGLSQAALSVPLQPGDEILTWDQEYPSNFYPWRMAAEKSKARVVQVASENYLTPVEKLLNQVNSKTKAIAISWVQFQAGAVTDLKALSEKLKGSGIWLVADIIQGAGVRPFNFHETGFDIVCSGSHKYMCSGYGAGFMLAKKERLAEMAPIEVGAMTFGNVDTQKGFSNPPKSDGSRFEPGSKPMIELIAMGSTLDLFQQIGIQNIYSEAKRLAAKLAKGLQDLGYLVIHQDGSIVNFSSENKPKMDSVAQALTLAKVSFVKRVPGYRLSTHAYNTDEQIDRVLELVSSVK